MSEEQLILVNENDEPVGTMEKMEAHRQGLLHRAFSVFIFDAKGKMLLQKRAAEKYHSSNLWTNACCSHPHPGETLQQAAARRLTEEMGFTTPIQEVFSFTYKAPVGNYLIEHEFDHVFTGQYAGAIKANPREVADWCYKEMRSIQAELEQHPQMFTTWFAIAFPKIEQWWQQHYGGR